MDGSDLHIADRHAAAGARARPAAAAADARAARRPRPSSSSTACSPTRRRSASRRRWSSTSRSASAASRASAATSSTSAARSARVYRLIPEKIRSFERARAAAGAGDAGRAAARPRARHRPDRQRQVDDAGGDARQDQRRAARAHPHDRGSDRVHPPAQELPRQPARGAQRHRRASRNALRAALREDPDIVLIGEMRDLETVEAALRIAETGHLTFGDAAHQLGGADDQPHHRHLPGAASRRRSGRSCRSCSRASSARRCCRGPTARGASCSLEILVPTPAIRNLIRDDKIHQIYGVDADRPGEARDADGEPVAGEPVHEAADHARDGAGGVVEQGRAAGHDQPRRRRGRRRRDWDGRPGTAPPGRRRRR